MFNTTLAPLPSWREICKAIFIRKPEDKIIANPWLSRPSDIPYWFSRSSVSIYIIVSWWIKYTDKKKPIIWIPDYFCNESLIWLREKIDCTFHFYKIHADFVPDWNHCNDSVTYNKPDIFILVHYFGSPSDGELARQFCNKYHCVLVEDGAHVLIPYKGIGSFGEFTFYSPHKLIAIPDGSVLIHRPKTKVQGIISNKDSTKIMEKVMSNIPQESPKPWFWLFKRILQKILPDFFWKYSKNNSYSSSADNYKAFKPFQSVMSKKLISANLKNINEYLFSRQINNSILKVFFDRKNNSNSSDIPYIAFLNCGSSQAKLLHLLKTNNHPVMKWPDLPPEVLKNPNEHSKAIELENNLLFFPIHQTMRTSVLKSIGISVSNIFNGNLKNDSYELEWYSNGRESWDKYISKADNSSLMQTWSYGESKNQTEGWSVSRGLVKNKGKTIAIFQALEKSWGPIKLIRINRGPIILDEKQDLKSKYQIFQLLSDTWKWWNGDILSIAPNMYNSPDNYGILRLVLNKNRKFDAWQSSLINLSFSSKELRNRLHGKWRNQLKKAESYSLELIIDKSDESFGWLLGLYEKMKKEKSFHGPSVDFYKALHKGDVDNHFIFKLRNHNSIVAGILVVCYGKSCVYQIGWNNSEGRKVYANNFLLWNAILYMKKLGYKWFDLGGIDSKNTPGIAKFKNGIKGENYKLIGEWMNVL